MDTHSPWCLSLWGGATSTTLCVLSPWLGAYTQCTHPYSSRGRTPRFLAERGARWFQKVELSPFWEKTKFYKWLISDTDVLVSV